MVAEAGCQVTWLRRIALLGGLFSLLSWSVWGEEPTASSVPEISSPSPATSSEPATNSPSTKPKPSSGTNKSESLKSLFRELRNELDSKEKQEAEQQRLYEVALTALEEAETHQLASETLLTQSRQLSESLKASAVAQDQAHRDELAAIRWRWLLASIAAAGAGVLIGVLVK